MYSLTDAHRLSTNGLHASVLSTLLVIWKSHELRQNHKANRSMLKLYLKVIKVSRDAHTIELYLLFINPLKGKI